MDIFRVRLNCIDHYQNDPTQYDPQLRNDVQKSHLHKEPRLPIIRVFGATETGQKVCAHIHGAFPYLYIEYDGSLEPEDVGAYIYRLHLSIDHALAVSYRRNVYGNDMPKFVARITLVKATPFYGFYVGYRFYLKIYMLNPLVMTRLAELLHQGVIMKRKFQPFEAHLQYLLQFMTDYNLYGCSYIEARKVCFRAPVPAHDEDSQSSHLWHSQSVSTALITNADNLPRVSHCSIEVDICVQDILNRHEIQERLLHHDFIERVRPLSIEKKLVPSMAGLWKDETRRRKKRMTTSAPGSSPFPPEVLVPMSADPRATPTTGWIHEDEYRQQVREIVREESLQSNGNDLNFDSYVQSRASEAKINTLMQSVEDLYPGKLGPLLGLGGGPDQAVEGLSSDVLVDEQKILDIEATQDGLFPDDSDEELFRDDEILEIDDEIAPSRSNGNESSGSRLPSGPSVEDAGLGTTEDSNDDCQTKTSNAPLHGSDSAASGHSLLGTSDSSSIEGIYVSRLQSGIATNELVPQRLISIAIEKGFISKATRGTILSESPHQPAKRRISTAKAGSQVKRRRVAFVEASPSTVADNERIPATSHAHEPASLGSQSTKLKARSSSGKNNTLQALNFSVVKDPNDASTRLRLSQQSSSQRSQDGQGLKNVMSESSLPAADKGPEKSSGQTKTAAECSLVSTDDTYALSAMEIGCTSRFNARFWLPRTSPPTSTNVTATLPTGGRPNVIYQDAYYSNDKDVPVRAREYAGQEFQIDSNTVPFLPDFDETGSYPDAVESRPDMTTVRNAEARTYGKKRRECSLKSWECAELAPSFGEVQEWWTKNQESANARPVASALRVQDAVLRPYLSQIDGVTPRDKHGFKYSQRKSSTSVQFEAQYMSTMSLEIHVNTRGKLVPNPEEDEVRCIFWYTKSDENFATGDEALVDTLSGAIILSEDGALARKVRKQLRMEVIEESSELELMVRMVEIVRTYDPDILTGYEVHGSSWGYLIERARFKYDYNLCDEFSRMKSNSFGRFGKEADRWGFNTTSTIRVTGRHMINIWRAMRGELNLLQYTMENVAWQLLHRRIPHYSWRTLTDWYLSGKDRDLKKLLRYYTTRTKLDLDLLEANEIIPRTSEQARLLGVDFFSVFSRGSQFKVESIMFRIAKPENFILVSPDRKQVGGQNALECLPLVMEPQSAFYNSPLVVLDFQSLYPSVMIAYNYCYSTFLGRIVNWRGANKMGFAEYRRQQRLLELLQDHVNIAPNGIMYCKPQVRKSLLAKMLAEILETRVMVKSGMKQDKEDSTLQKLLNNRQLALKLLANVTYGYTSASFSGRMPCSEIADSIVQTARETLERSIALIHSVEKWNAEVVYGDTDSLFIYLPGRTKDQAFDIGSDIAKTITEMNPRPMKLKFEKVYHPCVLLAKKRYVGYKYESKDQIKPDFDAKGIETVRRDGTPAEQKIEEKALRVLFETADLSQVKSYFQKQCEKIMRGAVSIQDFSFAKEVKLGTYSDKGPPPPGALISTKKMLEDARAEPQYGERVPYVVITGAPGARLIDRCIAPEDLLSSPHLELDSEYYISKNLIPPLERIFNLVGANVRQWYDEMPKVQRIRRVDQGGAPFKKTLESYMKAAACLVCNAKTKNEGSLCSGCLENASASVLFLQSALQREERKLLDVNKICQSCAGLTPLDDVPCDSRDCPVFYTRMKQSARYRTEKGVVEPAVQLLVDSVGTEELEW